MQLHTCFTTSLHVSQNSIYELLTAESFAQPPMLAETCPVTCWRTPITWVQPPQQAMGTKLDPHSWISGKQLEVKKSPSSIGRQPAGCFSSRFF